MLTLLQRLKQPFRRRTRQNTEARASPAKQDTSRPQIADRDGSNGTTQLRRTRSPSLLPVITDSGPPATGRYENEDIFWNSTMIEADRDPEKHRALSRRQTQRSPSQESLGLVGSNVRGYGKNLGPGIVRAEVKHTPPITRRSTVNGAQQLSKASKNPDQKDTDITIMMARVPETPSLLPGRPVLQQNVTLSTEGLNASKGFPPEHPVQIYQDASGNQHIIVSKQTNGETTAPVSVTHTNGNSAAPLSANQPSFVQNGASEARFREDELTWDRALHQILEHDCVDPVVKQTVRERIRAYEAKNGVSNGDNTATFAIAAGLVPNFSYPISGSEFYDRTPVDSSNNHPLSNGTTERNGDYGNPDTKPKLTNGSYLADTQSQSSTDTDSDNSDYGSTLLSEPPDRVFFLLSSQLTPSELSLHHRILNIIPPTSAPPFPSTIPPSNAFSSTPQEERLICKLNEVINGLQDRVSGLEDTLVPQLSTWLEQKTVMIDSLRFENTMLKIENVNLKNTIDFGNRILGGCWEREGTLYLTLHDLRVKKSKGLMRRFTRQGRDLQSRMVSNTSAPNGHDGTHFCSAPGITVDPQLPSDSTTPKTTTGGVNLSKREIDALFNMAEQNIRILKEDSDDMVTLIHGCMAMAERKPRVDPVLGSFRDV